MTDATPFPSAVRERTADLLLHRLAAEQTRRRLPSVVAGLVRDGRLVWAGGYGSSDGRRGGDAPSSDTQYRIGSITKSLIAVCVLRLRDEGQLDLADPLDRYLPGTALDGASVAQLLSHTSGLQAETDGPWWERTPGGDWAQLRELLGPASVRARGGRRFHYSNVGFGVLGELVAELRGAPWPEVVREELLEPLGMTRTSIRPTGAAAQGFAVHPWADVLLPEPEHDAGAMAPAGQLWCSVTDLARWAAFLSGRSGVDLLSEATLAEMREPQTVDDAAGAPWRTGYGLGLQLWNADGQRSYGHSGSMPGFLAYCRVDTASRDGVVVATNTTSGLGPDLVPDLARIMASEEPPLPAPWAPTPLADGVLELLGPWYWGPSPLVLVALGDGLLDLRGLQGAGRSSRFRRGADGSWVGLDGYYRDEVLRPVRDADGVLRSLDLASFVFTREPYDPQAPVPGGVDEAGWR